MGRGTSCPSPCPPHPHPNFGTKATSLSPPRAPCSLTQVGVLLLVEGHDLLPVLGTGTVRVGEAANTPATPPGPPPHPHLHALGRVTSKEVFAGGLSALEDLHDAQAVEIVQVCGGGGTYGHWGVTGGSPVPPAHPSATDLPCPPHGGRFSEPNPGDQAPGVTPVPVSQHSGPPLTHRPPPAAA